MSCSWCDYDLVKESYVIFDHHRKPKSVVFCSLNCCVAHISNCEEVEYVEQMIESLYIYYRIKGYISEAPSKYKLKKFGGSLEYSEYRQNFICPKTQVSLETYENEYNYTEDDEFDEKYIS